jgi:serine O-acetyltransferase
MKKKSIVQLILKSYETTPIQKDHCDCPLPSNHKVKQMIGQCKALIYPGYFGKTGNKGFGEKWKTIWLVWKLRRILISQISSSLLYIANEHKKRTVNPQSKVLTEAFLNSLPSLREDLSLDLEAHFIGDPAAFNKDEIVVSYPGMYAIMIYRIAHRLWDLKVPLLPRMMTEFAHRETGIDIHPGATIGKSFFIDHGTGVVIGETAEIGEHVKIYQGVTLGALSTAGGQFLKGTKRHPTIGDYVTIYAGATILGGKTLIGPKTTIGANVFITDSVKAESKVSNKNQEILVKEKSI